MLKRLFTKKSPKAEDRYTKFAARFVPSECLDPCTLEMVRLAADDLVALYQQQSPVVETDEAARIWQSEVKRLVFDGYILGRIEDNTEDENFRFDHFGADAWQEAVEFVFVGEQAITRGLQTGSFSGPPPADIAELLALFCQPAIFSLAKHASNSRLIGEALSRAINSGREIALIEGFYFNPNKRADLLNIRASISGDEIRAMDTLVKRLGVLMEPSLRAETLFEYLLEQRS